jgi:hypothetical protein
MGAATCLSAGITTATAAVLTCDPGDKNIGRTTDGTRVGCCRSCEAKSEMSAISRPRWPDSLNSPSEIPGTVHLGLIEQSEGGYRAHGGHPVLPLCRLPDPPAARRPEVSPLPTVQGPEALKLARSSGVPP